MPIDVEPTAQTIDQAAERFRQAAVDLDRLAATMRERNDLEYAAEALVIAHNTLANSRLDLLVTRPLREYQTAHAALERSTLAGE